MYKGHDYMHSVIIVMAERCPITGFPRLWKWLAVCVASWSNRQLQLQQLNTQVLGEAEWWASRRVPLKHPNWALKVLKKEETEERKGIKRSFPVGKKRETMRSCPNRSQKRVSGDKVSTLVLKVIDGHVKRDCLPLIRYPCAYRVHITRGTIIEQNVLFWSTRSQERRVNNCIGMFLGKNVLIVGHLWKERRCP